MNILFFSNLFPKESEKEVQEKMKFNMYDAANVLQWNIIEGMVMNECRPSVLNILPVDSWPQYYRDAWIPRYDFAKGEGLSAINAGFCNVKYLKRLWIKRVLVRESKKWAEKTQSLPNRTLISYSLNTAFIASVRALKQKNSDMRAIAIVADLPEFSAPAHNIFRKWYYSYLKNKIQKQLSLFDGFVLLTDHMAERLKIKVPYVVMEGIAPQPCEEVGSGDFAFTPEEKTILYTGSMNKKYGILVLLEAFSLLRDPTYRLVLCGLGNAEEEIKLAVQKDQRISFMGKVRYQQVLQMQKNATVLVNPRQNNEEFTKYSFPSKTMEYLAAGVPVVAYKLDGIPDEYDEYLQYVPDNSPQALANVLQSICEKTDEERLAIGQKGQNFVLQEKNNVKQVEKILQFINRFEF